MGSEDTCIAPFYSIVAAKLSSNVLIILLSCEVNYIFMKHHRAKEPKTCSKTEEYT